MSKEALLIVDPQKDFCPGGTLPVPQGDEIVEPVNNLLKHARENNWTVVVSRDWHPETTVHFDKWPSHCVQGTEGANFHNELDINGVTIFSKGMGKEEDSYTAFDGVTDQGERLEEHLRRSQVLQLFVVGLATDYCVRASALDALVKGFDTTLVLDGIRAVNVNPGDGDKAIEEMISKGVKIVTSKEVLS